MCSSDDNIAVTFLCSDGIIDITDIDEADAIKIETSLPMPVFEVSEAQQRTAQLFLNSQLSA
jgi:hypothetical protein